MKVNNRSLSEMKVLIFLKISLMNGHVLYQQGIQSPVIGPDT